MEEVWKDIKGYPHYKVSNLGNVMSNYKKDWHLIKLSKQYAGYLRVTLFNKNGAKTKRVHRLVADAFIPNPEGKETVDHINGVRTDNRVENLRWCSIKENNSTEQSVLNKRIKRIEYFSSRENIEKAQKNIAKLVGKPVEQYDLNGEFIKEYVSISDAARVIGKGNSLICNCCKGKRTSAYGFIWKYKRHPL